MEQPQPQPQFDLANDPFIPFATPTGDMGLGLRDALVRAHELPPLPAVQPLELMPLIRLLVDLVLCTLRIVGIADVEKLWRMGHFDETAIDGYFAEHAGRFDLFSPTRPFLQVAGLQPASGEPKPATGLRLHVASGNNVPLFSPFTEGDRPVTPAPQAALELLALLAYDTASIKTGAAGDRQMSGGKTTGNPTGPLGQLGGVLLVGRNLFETLLLNTPGLPPSAQGTPTWEKEFTADWSIRQPDGIRELLVWPSRRVRLVPSDDGTGVVGAVVAAGDRLLLLDHDLEPHTRWAGATKGDVPWRPRRWQPGSFAWRGLDTLLALESAETQSEKRSAMVLEQASRLAYTIGFDYPLSAVCVGVAYGNQSAVIEDIFLDQLPLPMAALRRDGATAAALANVATQAEEVRRALNNLHDNLRIASGGDKLEWDKGLHPGNDLMGQLTTPTRRLLTGLQTQPDKLEAGQLAWELAVWRLATAAADALLDEFTATAMDGRTVKSGSSERTIRLADAQAWFFASLRKTFGRAAGDLRAAPAPAQDDAPSTHSTTNEGTRA